MASGTYGNTLPNDNDVTSGTYANTLPNDYDLKNKMLGDSINPKNAPKRMPIDEKKWGMIHINYFFSFIQYFLFQKEFMSIFGLEIWSE